MRDRPYVYWKHEHNYRTLHSENATKLHTFDNTGGISTTSFAWWHTHTHLVFSFCLLFVPWVYVWWHLLLMDLGKLCTHTHTSFTYAFVQFSCIKRKANGWLSIGQLNKRPTNVQQIVCIHKYNARASRPIQGGNNVPLQISHFHCECSIEMQEKIWEISRINANRGKKELNISVDCFIHRKHVSFPLPLPTAAAAAS